MFPRVLLAAALLLPCSLLAQIQRGAAVYTAPDKGFEGYLTAAFQKKGVLLKVVLSKGDASYIVMSDLEVKEPHEPLVELSSKRRTDYGSVTANIRVVDAKTSVVVFSYTVWKNSADNLQGAAEACAKHLQEFIGK